jgi:hypothetical protein
MVLELGVDVLIAIGEGHWEKSVAGEAAAWQDVDVSQSAGEIVSDRRLSLPPHWEGGSRRDGMRMQIQESRICPIFNGTVRMNRMRNGELIWDFVVVSESMTNRGLVMGEGTSRHGIFYHDAASR